MRSIFCLYFRWPHLIKIYNKRKCKEHINFAKEFKKGLKCRRELHGYLKKMSEMHYYKDDLSDNDMKDFDLFFSLDVKDEYNMNHYFLIDELMSFLAQSERFNKR